MFSHNGCEFRREGAERFEPLRRAGAVANGDVNGLLGSRRGNRPVRQKFTV
jgi:hypothetical protein